MRLSIVKSFLLIMSQRKMYTLIGIFSFHMRWILSCTCGVWDRNVYTDFVLKRLELCLNQLAESAACCGLILCRQFCRLTMSCYPSNMIVLVTGIFYASFTKHCATDASLYLTCSKSLLNWCISTSWCHLSYQNWIASSVLISLIYILYSIRALSQKLCILC
jgi:hypothetical protein